MDALVNSLAILPKELKANNKEEYLREIISLSKKVINDSYNSTLISNQKFCLMSAYAELGEIEKAKEIVNNQPHIFSCKESLMRRLVTGDEGQEHLQSFLTRLVDLTAQVMREMTYPKYAGDKYSLDERIYILEKIVLFFDLIFDGEDPLFYNNRYTQVYSFLGKFYARKQDEKNMYRCLEKAKQHSLNVDGLSEDVVYYENILFNKLRHSSLWNSKNVEETAVEEFKDFLRKNEFDFVRDKTRFKKLVL